MAGAKAALEYLIVIAALEVGGHQININAVVPGMTETPMVQASFDNDAINNADKLARCEVSGPLIKTRKSCGCDKLPVLSR